MSVFLASTVLFLIPLSAWLTFKSKDLIHFVKNRIRPPIGYKAYKTLLGWKVICYGIIRWNDPGVIRSPIYQTVAKFDVVLDLYKKQPEFYGLLMYKYGDTFNLIEIVLNDAKEKGLLDDLVLLKKVRDMMDYPIRDFKELEKMLAQTESLKREQELEVLYRNLAGEMEILKDLRKFNE